MATSQRPLPPPPLPPRRREAPAPPIHEQPPWEGALTAKHWRQSEYLTTIPPEILGDTKGLCWALVLKWIEHGGSFRAFGGSLAELAVKKELVESHNDQCGGLLDDELLIKKHVSPMALAWKGEIAQHDDASSWQTYLVRNPCLCYISLGSRVDGVAGHAIGVRVTGTEARFFDPNCGEFTFSTVDGPSTFLTRLSRLLYHTLYGDLLSRVTIRKYSLPKLIRD